MKVLQPPGWAAPKGCANGVVARGETIVLAGRIRWNAACAFESDDLVEQVRQALPNVRALLAEAGAAREHIVRMTRFLTDKPEYLARARSAASAARRLAAAPWR
jgi:enamine deaminase RidA (YjgF/YER057c/UK114 family)